ncbi:MAG TPA: glycosyltransferase family 9 protein [Chitinophagaceae bacterium]
MKFLIIRFSSIGDIVLTTPVIRCLKKQTGGEVHFVTKEAFRPILAANPYIDKIHVLSHSFDLLLHELKLEDYDAVIDLHHNLRTLKIRQALGKPWYAFNKLNIRKYIYVNLKWNVMPDVHIVDRYLETAGSFGVQNDGAGLDYFIPPNQLIKDKDIPASHLLGYIGIVIGAAHRTKRYPVHKLKELCDGIAHPIILLGGPEDRAAGDEIASGDPVKVYNSCGKFSINESADLVKRAKVIVSNDTGLMHIAAAFRKPIISLWGNTVPSFGMYPYYGSRHIDTGNQAILQVNKLSCRPCSKIGYDRCPRGHFKCMENIEVSAIIAAIQQRLRP